MGGIMTDRLANIPDRDLNHNLDAFDPTPPHGTREPAPSDGAQSIPPQDAHQHGTAPVVGREPLQLDFNSALAPSDPLVPSDEAHRVEPTDCPRRNWGKTAALLGAVLGIGVLGFVGIRNLGATSAAKDKFKDRKLKVTPVLVATATQKTVPVQIQAIGTVQSGQTVSVTPQVNGRITGVFFKKGQEIKKGQLLFTLDEQPQQAVIQQAQGVILKDQALVQQARATLDKDTGLIATAQATLQKDLQAIEQAKATLDKDTGAIAQAQATLQKDLAQIEQAKAVLAKDVAQSKFAQGQSQRYGRLYKQGAVSLDQAQQYAANKGVSAANIQADTQAIRNAEAVVQGDRAAIKNAQAVVRGDRAAIKNAQAVVQGDRVAIENAKAVVRGDQAAISNAQAGVESDRGTLKNAQVQLGYTKIYAPIDGRAGNILVQQGNVAQASGTTPLMTIVRVRPLQVAFAVPASNLAEVQNRMNGNKLPVDVQLADSNSKPISGQLSFVNNTVDNTTGTIQLIGDFDNSDNKLYPGQYVNATLTLSQTPNAIVVPSQAVQNGPNGQFVFVVKPDSTVENVPVVATSAPDGVNAIQKGLKPGDRVVTDGQANLVSGAQVKVREPGSASGNAASEGRSRRRQGGTNTQGNAVPTDRSKSSDPVTGDLTPGAKPDRAISPGSPASGDSAQTGERPQKWSGKRRSTSPSPDPQQSSGN
jgi:membrane fusion protein, multidrug efflux system